MGNIKNHSIYLLRNSNAEKMRPSRPDLGVIKATEGQDGCPRCGGAVFAAETMLARGTVWPSLLSPLTLEFEIRKLIIILFLFCFVIGILFQVWHKTCFNCKECKRVLDSVLACDGPDRDVYCKLCYAKKFGPKGYGFGAGGAFLMADSIPYVDDCCQNTVSIFKLLFIYFMTWI